MDTSIIVAIIGLVGSVLVQIVSIVVNNNVIKYRIEQLEKKVEKHNNLIERVYELEKNNSVQDVRLERIDHRIEDLERVAQ